MAEQDDPQSTTIAWDPNGQPVSTRFNDVYFSKHDGLAESRYVFLQQNELPQRFEQLNKQAFTEQTFVVAETGFGTGLNFLATWQCFLQQASQGRLHFISTEKYPLDTQQMRQALALWPELKDLSELLVDAWQKQSPEALHEQQHYFEFGQVSLTLLTGDVCHGLAQLLPKQHPNFMQKQWRGVDAWFLDGFAPAKNPDMWRTELFQLMAQLSNPGTSFSTFTAAGMVRRGLSECGFQIEKIAGFGRKRHMLRGQLLMNLSPKPEQDIAQKRRKNRSLSIPWAINQKAPTIEADSRVAIIGGGLAGCQTAHALAKRGIKVTLFEQRETLAGGASGNPQGMLYARLSGQSDTLGEFNLASLLYAQAFYTPFWQQGPNSHGEQCGLLQLSFDETRIRKHQGIADTIANAAFLENLDQKQASAIANTSIECPALFMPYSGWINPVALCHWLTKQPEITVKTNSKVTRLAQKDDLWQVYNDESCYPEQYSTIVICSANDAREFEQTAWLPTKPLRGQVSTLASDNSLSQIKTVITGEGYIAPASIEAETFTQTIGASYNLKDKSETVLAEEHESNLEQLRQLLPRAITVSPKITSGRASLRCTSPDYLPIVGAVPDKEIFLKDYKGITENAQTAIEKTGAYLPGVYLNIAHGSRGLAYTPLCAETLAREICAEPPPIPQSLADSLKPGRFLIRQLKRKNKITSTD